MMSSGLCDALVYSTWSGSRRAGGEKSPRGFSARQSSESRAFLSGSRSPTFQPSNLPTFLPFCVLLDGVFSLVKGIVSFDLAHTLLLKPRYHFGIHDWKHVEETRLRAPGGGQHVNHQTESKQVCVLSLPSLQPLCV